MKKTILYTAALLISATTIAQIPTDGLVAHYPFNANANDESTNSNNGTVNGATLTEDRFGNTSSAYSFDGIDDFIALPNFPSTPVLSVSLWVKRISNIDTVQLWDNGGAGGGYVEAGIRLLIDNIEIGRWQHQHTNEEIIQGWFNIVAVYTPDSTMMYIDGQLISVENTNSTLPNIMTVNGVNQLGRYRTPQLVNNLRLFKGQLDDVRFYNKILTSEEINSLHFESSCIQTQINNISVTDTLNIYLSQITTSVNDASQAATTIKVYPNPTAKDLTVSIDNYTNLSGVTIKVLDAQSVEVHNEVVTSATQSIDVSSWTAGIYFLHVMNGSTTVDVKKIVVNN
jgi:hypothetical protein